MDHKKAQARLARIPLFKPIIKAVGPCTLAVMMREPYEALVRAIAHQQVHGRAAEAMLGRLLALHAAPEFPPPASSWTCRPRHCAAAAFPAPKWPPFVTLPRNPWPAWCPAWPRRQHLMMKA